MRELSRSAAALVCASAIMLACAACSRGASRGERVRIAIGGQTQLVYLATSLAQELGFYRDEGLDVELQDFEGGAKALQALLGGSADVVSGFYDHTIQLAAEQRELVAFVTMLRYPGLVLVTSPQAAEKITSVEALKGRIAGVTTPGSSSHMFLTFLLTRHNVPADAVSVTAIGGGPSAVAGIESGRVDVGWIGDPGFTLVKKRNPGARILVDLRSEQGTREIFGVPMYPSAVLYTSGDWLRANRATAQRLARAIVKTLEWMQTHSDEDIADRVPQRLRGEDVALYADSLKASRAIFSTDGMMPADGPAAVYKVLAASLPKVRDAKIDLSKTYTNELVAARGGDPSGR
jgi:NitT/TauT family transport system substrate-binding protein